MYYTRAVRSRGIRQAILQSIAVLLIAEPLAARQSLSDAERAWQPITAALGLDSNANYTLSALTANHEVHRESITSATTPIELTLIVPPQSSEVEALTRAASNGVTRLEDWLGPLPVRTLTLVDVPSNAGAAGASFPGAVITSTRWLNTSRDFAFERSLLAALARQYTFSLAPEGQPAWFEECMALYLGTRLIHEQLEGRNFATPRFFGGFVPFSLRPVLNSPRPTDPRPRLRHIEDVEQPANVPWRAASAAKGSESQRCADALHTLERYMGWPTFQHMLSLFMERFRGHHAGPDDLAAVAADVRGADMSWYFGPAFRFDLHYDYAVSSLRTVTVDEGFETSVTVSRLGSAVFPLPLLIRFADGTAITERIDGREASSTVVYRSAAPATLASIDPDAVLLLDVDRTNNTQVVAAPRNPLGVRLALNWMIWLQDAMLTYTGAL